jgi:hypothetical protein
LTSFSLLSNLQHMKTPITIAMGERIFLAPINGNTVEVVRNLFGHVLIINGTDQSYGHVSVKSAEIEACAVLGREVGFRALP